MKPDLFEAPDYYNLDELLTEEHLLVRDAAREWVKRDVSPIIEKYAPQIEAYFRDLIDNTDIVEEAIQVIEPIKEGLAPEPEDLNSIQGES